NQMTVRSSETCTGSGFRNEVRAGRGELRLGSSRPANATHTQRRRRRSAQSAPSRAIAPPYPGGVVAHEHPPDVSPAPPPPPSGAHDASVGSSSSQSSHASLPSPSPSVSSRSVESQLTSTPSHVSFAS